MVLRQKVQLALRSGKPALAQEAAAANRNLRLNNVVAAAKGVKLRVQENADTVLLVILKNQPEYWQQSDKRQAKTEKPFIFKAADKNHADKNRDKGQRCAQVRLTHNQNKRHQNIGKDRQIILKFLQPLDALIHKRRQADNQKHLGKFTRLKGQRANLNPALRTKLAMSDKHNDEQQNNIKDIQLAGVVFQHMIIKGQRH